MAEAIIIDLRLQGTAGVTLRRSGQWECTSDPKGVVPEDSGTWVFGTSSGTYLVGASGNDLFTLAGLQFSKAKKGDEGDILRAGANDELGTWLVSTVV